MLNSSQHFPIFTTNQNLVYLDSAASGLKCAPAIEAMTKYYEENGTNVHRGLYNLSEAATAQYEEAREVAASFIKAEPNEIIFTSGTTASLNMTARLLEQKIKPGDEIVLTHLEHHANLIPWQELAKRTGAVLKFIEIDKDYQLDFESAEKIIGPKTKVVAFTAASNVTGTIIPVKELISLAKKYNAYTVVDAAQFAAHREINVKEWGADFVAFSGHKLYGPTGVGVLFGKAELLNELEPVNFGGEMIREVTYEKSTWADAPAKFEPGTPPIAEAIGLAAAVTFIQGAQTDEKELIEYTFTKLKDLVTIIGPKDSDRLPIFSFTLGDAHPHDVAEILNREHIAVRAGHHCAMPLMKYLDLVGTTRASFGLYTTKEDIDTLVEGIKKAKEILKV